MLVSLTTHEVSLAPADLAALREHLAGLPARLPAAPPRLAPDAAPALWAGELGVLSDWTAGTPLRVAQVDETARAARFEYPQLGLTVVTGPSAALEGAPFDVLVGPAGALWWVARGRLADGGRVFVDGGPVPPAAVAALSERFGCVAREVGRDPDGGWLGVDDGRGPGLAPLRDLAALERRDFFGVRVPPNAWGALHRDGRPLGVDASMLIGTGGTRIELGLPAMALTLPDGRGLDPGELHGVLCSFPVFGYSIDARGGAVKLRVQRAPDDAAVAARLEDLRATVAETLGASECVLEAPRRERAQSALLLSDVALPPFIMALWTGSGDQETVVSAWMSALAWFEARARPVTLAGEGLPPAALEAARRLQAALPDPDAEARVVTVAAGDATGDAELHVRALPADDERDAVLLAARSREHLELGVALLEGRADGAALERVVLSGVGRELTARLVLGRGRLADASPLWIDPARCDPCGACAELCPVSAIDGAARPVPTFDFDRCVQCALCVEHCPQAAIRPIVTTQMNLAGRDLTRAQERLATIRRRDVAPIDDPITRRLHRAPAIVAGRPLVILGLATVTMMEHAAALLIDGELVAAVEEERLARVRHYRWSDPGWPGSSLASDPSLPIAAAWPARAIEAVLGLAGMDLDRVDAIAINGVPARLSHAFLGAGSWRPPQVLQSRGLFHVPHHLAHAASVYGLSNLDDAWILSVDGRGDFETATLWRAEGDDIAWLDAEPFAPDRSLGGVYETITRVLGFGSHGQGSTMALAALGEPRVRLDDCLGLDDRGRMVLSEWRADRRFAARTRGRDAPLTQEHKDLAASAQRALEETVAGWLGARVREPNPRLLVCGGVALNCRMNGELRRKFEPKDMSAPPGANDAGTAIGAALIAHRELTGTLPRLGLGHTHLGAAWSDDAIARSLARMRVPHARVDPARATAELLAGGAVVCWFQGRMEFGPRALGGRSILGDPRRAELKARMNAMKSRQPWRPFGPSVLAGEQGAWFLEDWDSRFMLFAVTVRPERRAEIPVVVHDDGTTRPQVVHAEEHPRYHAMIQAFKERTGVPMVVNTSFNRGGEPIVHTPAEALRSFVGLGADALVLGDCLVRRSELARRPRG